jgi:hypothetical protein
MRLQCQLLLLLFALLLSFPKQVCAGGFLGGHMTVSAGYGMKIVDGTSENSDGTTFDITAPAASSIAVYESVGSVIVGAIRGGRYGYALPSKVFHGFSLCLDYRLHRRWSLFLGWDAFWRKKGATSLGWEADPQGIHAGLSGSFNYESSFHANLFSLGFRFFVIPDRWYLMVMSEPYFLDIEETFTWLRSQGGSTWVNSYHERRHKYTCGGHAAGIGSQFPLSTRSNLAIEADYRFRVAEWLNGLSVRTAFRYRP